MALAWPSVADGSSSREQIGEVGVASTLGSASARRARSTNNEKVWHLSETVCLITTASPLFPATNVFGSNLPFNNFNCSPPSYRSPAENTLSCDSIGLASALLVSNRNERDSC